MQSIKSKQNREKNKHKVLVSEPGMTPEDGAEGPFPPEPPSAEVSAP